MTHTRRRRRSSSPTTRASLSLLAHSCRGSKKIGHQYAPGSTFKLITIAAALEEGLTRADEVLDCQMGAIYIAGHRIRDHKPFGLLTVEQVLAKSSDVGTIKLGMRLGDARFYQWIRRFGFGRPTGLDLPGEAAGLTKPAERWSKISVGAISMGQEIGVTGIQLVQAVGAIANGGLLMRPWLVRRIVAEHGGSIDVCTHTIDCSIRSLWRTLQHAVDQVLAKTTLQDLLPKNDDLAFPTQSPVQLTSIRLN